MSIISTQDGNNFGNIIGPICSTNIGAGDDNGAGDATHFLLCCHLYMHIIIELLNIVSHITQTDVANLGKEALIELLL